MPPRDYRDFLADIVAACRSLIRFVEGMTLEAYLADERTRYAVMRAYEIMGEAVRHLPEELKSANPEIPWATMAAVRNRITPCLFRDRRHDPVRYHSRGSDRSAAAHGGARPAARRRDLNRNGRGYHPTRLACQRPVPNWLRLTTPWFWSLAAPSTAVPLITPSRIVPSKK